MAKSGENCQTCNTSYEACTERVLNNKAACCPRCANTDTHAAKEAPPHDPALPTVEDVLTEYAAIARNIYSLQTAGEYTWQGFLFHFVGDLDKARAHERAELEGVEP